MDIRYAFILLPLAFVMIPYFLTGNFLLLGGVTVVSFVFGAIILAIITNLRLGGSAEAIATGASFRLGLGSEGGYTLFVLIIGGMFYLGAQIAQFITPILDFFIILLNWLIGALNWLGLDLTNLSTTTVSTMGTVFNGSIGDVYPLDITVAGISVFGTLDILMGCLFVLGLYFMISSRGK